LAVALNKAVAGFHCFKHEKGLFPTLILLVRSRNYILDRLNDGYLTPQKPDFSGLAYPQRININKLLIIKIFYFLAQY
jgi:hypothetical protein